MKVRNGLWSAECVSNGHPDKVADQVSDAILDACLAQDPNSKVACETLIKGDHIVLAGEITTLADVDFEKVARKTVENIGYTFADRGFDVHNCTVLNLLSKQSPQINAAVSGEVGAGDQGIIFGYATDETESRMPLAIDLARRLIRAYQDARYSASDVLYPDAKSQVTLRYNHNGHVQAVDTVILSFHHANLIGSMHELRKVFQEWIGPRFIESLKPEERNMFVNGTQWLLNTAGLWTIGGPEADAGVTGRKIVVDNYGGDCPVGGGAFSGKDPTKVDRSAAYAARQVARAIIENGYASKAQVQIAYAIGQAAPISVNVETFGTEKVGMARINELVAKYDLRPAAIIERLDLRQPIYERTARCGHFGYLDYPWERDWKVGE